jgi:hypothetical protein
VPPNYVIIDASRTNQFQFDYVTGGSILEDPDDISATESIRTRQLALKALESSRMS